MLAIAALNVETNAAFAETVNDRLSKKIKKIVGRLSLLSGNSV